MDCDTPKRPRCDGSTGPILFYGTPFQNIAPGDDGTAEAVQNNTVVNGCSPFEMPSTIAVDSCYTPPAGRPGYDGTNNCAPANGAWTDYLPLFNNTYSATGAKVVLNGCDGSGFKNAQAGRAWYGALPIVYSSSPGSEPTVRYRTIDFSVVWSYVDTDPGGPLTADASVTGTITQDNATGLFSIDYTASVTSSNDTAAWADKPNAGKYDIETYLLSLATLTGGTYNPDGSVLIGDSSLFGVGPDVLTDFSSDATNYYGQRVLVVDTITWILTFTITRSNPTSFAQHDTDLDALLHVIDFTDEKSYPVRADGFVNIAPYVSLNQRENDVDFMAVAPPVRSCRPISAYSTGNPPYFTGGYNVTDPDSGIEYVAKELHGVGGASLDVFVPTGVQHPTHFELVIVHDNEGTLNSLPSGFTMNSSTGEITGTFTEDWGGFVIVKVTGDVKYDGSVIGTPNSPGYGYNGDGTKKGHFNFYHTAWGFCEEDGPYYVHAFGGWTPPFLPQNFTQWTDPTEPGISTFNFDTNLVNPTRRVGGAFSPTSPRSYPKGQWLVSNGKFSIKQKWQEAKKMIHSYDFAHCGTHWTSYSPDCGITFPNAGDPATCDPTEIWNDTDPKGTYVLATWSAAGTTLVQGCITIDPCAPFILCISNNEGDMPGNGVLIDCATPVGFNALNGGRVHCDIFQQMADLLWVDCTGDHTGVPPVVEAFCTWPAGAPALPVGVTFPPAFPESSNNPPPAGWPWAG